MIRWSVRVGAVMGVFICLCGLYPVLSLVVPTYISSLPKPLAGTVLDNSLIDGGLVMVASSFMTLAILAIGLLAAKDATSWRDGAKTGLIAGATAGIIAYITLLSPANAIIAFGELSDYPAFGQDIADLQGPLEAYVADFQSGIYVLEAIVSGFILFWVLEGALVGWWRSSKIDEKPHSTLLQFWRSDKDPRLWVGDNESTLRSGLIIGTLVGGLFFSTLINQAIVELGWPEFDQILRNAAQTTESAMVYDILLPFVSISMLGLGAIVVLLSKNPPSRFRARLSGTILAVQVILLFLVAALQRSFYFALGTYRYKLFYDLSVNNINAADSQIASLEVVVFLNDPAVLIVLSFIAPWLFLGVVWLISLLIGSTQGLIYATIIPFFYKQPVDVASTMVSRIRTHPEDTLPIFFDLFQDTEEAYDVLPHLCVMTYKPSPAVSKLAAAYHTLGTKTSNKDDMDAVHTIDRLLSEQANWRWGPDLQAVYRSLNSVLEANTLDQILQIQPPPTHQTSSLPPALMQTVDRIGMIIQELHKVERVEDLSTKLIFLENTLDSIHRTEKAMYKMIDRGEGTVLPSQSAVLKVLDHWQSVVLKSVKWLKGRADITAVLHNKISHYVTPLPIVIQVSNQGLNVAQQVRIHMMSDYEYRVVNENKSRIEILPPGEEKQVTFSIMPRKALPRLRVEWEVIYDDAVDADRSVSFADVVEFKQPDKPFTRIFPIPYVTGTPLKTDDVFVGREDVFSFIKENLLGMHQNNVIILHGQRRTGKTSVLYRLGDVMQETHFGVLIDMQGKPARGEADFLFSIADDIVFALEDHGIEVDVPERTDFEEAPEFFFRSRFLRHLQPHLGERNLLLMFDEFEELQRRVEDGRLQPEIFQFLRNLMQHEKRVDFVFSGTHKLEDLGAEYWSVLFNIAAYKPITFLSYNEVKSLILTPVEQYNIEYDPLAIDQIVDVTAGHPYFTQLVLHEMIVYHNEKQRTYLTVMDVNHALDQIVERGEAHFKYIWSESSEEEKLVLRGVTELLVGHDSANVQDLYAHLASRGYESADDWFTALSLLEGRDILTRKSAKSQLYRFKVDLIRLWIDRTRPPL